MRVFTIVSETDEVSQQLFCLLHRPNRHDSFIKTLKFLNIYYFGNKICLRLLGCICLSKTTIAVQDIIKLKLDSYRSYVKPWDFG